VNVVYDTMVFLQIVTVPNRTHATLQAIRNGAATLCLSLALVAEMRDVLSRQKIRVGFPALTPQVVEDFVAEMLSLATLFDPVANVFTWLHHPDDDHIFNLAVEAKADFLVTWENRILKLAGDVTDDGKRLRALAPELKIVTPKQFSEQLRLLP
jgi:putative PIN family toxin of toxin-antitoxin system